MYLQKKKKQPLGMPSETTYYRKPAVEKEPLEHMMPGYDYHNIISIPFKTALNKAIHDTCVKESNDKQRKTFIVELARQYQLSGIPQEETTHWTIAHFKSKIKELLIRKIFQNVYNIEKYFGKKPYFPT